MYEFIERLIGIAIPRMRDFRGLNPRAFDGFAATIRSAFPSRSCSGNRLRQDRRRAGARYRDHDTARNDRRRICAVAGIQLPVQELAMAKVSITEREKKREKIVAKYAENARIEGDHCGSQRERRRALGGATETAGPSAQCQSCACGERCGQTGRPRGVYRKFGLGRNKLREAAMRGDVPWADERQLVRATMSMQDPSRTS